MGLADPRTYGSGNPGATNVLRSGSKWAAALTLLGDGFKGWIAVWLVALWSPHGIGDTGVALVAVAVVLGHLYPIFFVFAAERVLRRRRASSLLSMLGSLWRRRLLGSSLRCSFATHHSRRWWRDLGAFLFCLRLGIRRAIGRAGRHRRLHRVSPSGEHPTLLGGTERRIGENSQTIKAQVR